MIMSSLPFENDPINFLLLDVIVSLATIAFAVCLDIGLIITTHRPLDVLTNDPIFSRLHIIDAVASPQSVAFITGLLFPLLLIFIDLCIRQSMLAKSVRRLTGYGLGVGITLLACGSLRAAAGGPSPDFLSVCAPFAIAAANNTAARITNARTQCIATGLPLATLGSFPSTPAALAVYSTFCFAAYLRNHFSTGSAAVATLLHAAPIIGGIAAAAAQAADARAHIGDVIVGVLIGAACAAIVQVRFLGGLKRSYLGEDDSEEGGSAQQHQFFSAAIPVPTAGPPLAASGKADVTAARTAAWASAWALAHAKAAADAAAVRAATAATTGSPSLLRLAMEPTSSDGMALETLPASAPHIPRSGFSLASPVVNPQTITQRMAAVHARAMGLP